MWKECWNWMRETPIYFIFPLGFLIGMIIYVVTLVFVITGIPENYEIPLLFVFLVSFVLCIFSSVCWWNTWNQSEKNLRFSTGSIEGVASKKQSKRKTSNGMLQQQYQKEPYQEKDPNEEQNPPIAGEAEEEYQPLIMDPYPTTIFPVFNRPLEQLVENSEQMPLVFVKCINFLGTPYSLKEEGLLRVPGSKLEVERICGEFDEGKDVVFEKIDPNNVADILKSFFRQLPEPLVPRETNETISSIVALFKADNRLNIDQSELVHSIKEEIYQTIGTLPDLNYRMLRALILLFCRILDYSAYNKMSVNNIITCIAPTLRCTPGLIKFCMEDYNYFFGENQQEVEVEVEVEVDSIENENENLQHSSLYFSWLNQ